MQNVIVSIISDSRDGSYARRMAAFDSFESALGTIRNWADHEGENLVQASLERDAIQEVTRYVGLETQDGLIKVLVVEMPLLISGVN